MKIKLFTRRTRFIVLAAIILIVLLYPFETTVVPTWTLRVVDEEGLGYQGIRAVEHWKHYSLEIEAGTHSEELRSDQNGVVSFPRRTIRMSLVGRVLRTALTTALQLFHGSTGVRAYIIAGGPMGDREVNYVPNQPLSDRLVLPRRKEPQGP
jgi:hypothetical protein